MRVSLLVPLLAVAFFMRPALAGEARPTYRSHAPMRPLPAPSNRPLDKGPAYFVDPVKGQDRQEGSKEKPWRTVSQAVKRLKPGDTLYLRGGIYYECVTIAVVGTAEKPITVRSYPGELAILDGGHREFLEDPVNAWEPVPDGAPGEFRSTKSYTHGGYGNFGDSMVPLHRYLHLSDLRSSNEFWVKGLGDRHDDPKGLYCGPGVWRNPETGRIHIRLAHTQLPGLGKNHYRGETDPRKLPLIIAGHDHTLRIEGARHLRVQDLVIRGAQRSTVLITEDMEDTERDAEVIVLDGLTIYGGRSALQTRRTRGLILINCALHGHAAPWHSRAHHKYRAHAGYLVMAAGRDFEFSHCDFTDHHDALQVYYVDGLRLHHNFLDNFNDDGIEVGSKKEKGQVLIYQNFISRCLLPFSLHGKPGEKPRPIPSEEGSGVYIYRNIVDGRHGTYKSPPEAADASGAFLDYPTQGIAADHASPTWPIYYVYHNTFLLKDPKDGTYGFRWSAGLRESQRRVFNNIFVQIEGAPSFRVFPTANDDFQADGNLHWSVKAGAQYKGGLFDKFRRSPLFEASKKRYPPGWFSHDVLADPRFQALEGATLRTLDLRLQKGSPAIDAGVEIPATWPDPLRKQDMGRPDIGALPLGAAVFRAGKR
jgi:hypothetical protein